LRLGAPAALAGTKELLRAERPATLTEDFAQMQVLSAGYFASADGQEGMRAFAERRSPAWVVPD